MAELSEPARRGEFSIDWRSIIAGAVVAAGISFTLLAFGSAIGLSVASTSPSWRDSSGWLWFISGLYLVFVALCSYGAGGYLAARMQAPDRWAAETEGAFRDGAQGLVTWGLATLLGGVLALGTIAAGARLTASSAAISPSASVAGETILAPELDQLFRSERSAPNTANIEYDRSQAARILLKTSSRQGLSSPDRDNLVTLVANRAGINGAEASNRVTSIIAKSAEELHRARAAAVIEAFLVAAALMAGAAIAWFSAVEGGRDRERGTLPVWDWSLRGHGRV
ncbi:MAG: hypothetical protein ACREFL_00190 [Stellaceae bacterium]